MATNFCIADTFTDSLAHLSDDEQKAAKTTAFDLQMNPINSGMSLHKLDKAGAPTFGWRVSTASMFSTPTPAKSAAMTSRVSPAGSSVPSVTKMLGPSISRNPAASPSKSSTTSAMQ